MSDAMTARGAEALIFDLERANCLECGQVRSIIAAYRALEAELAAQAKAGERIREALASLISEIEDIGEHGADYEDFCPICRAIGVGKEALAALAPAQPAETENGK